MQNRITPTHFVEFYIGVFDLVCQHYNNVLKIESINEQLLKTESFPLIKTVAIGYIQYTTVPLSERLAKRGIFLNDKN